MTVDAGITMSAATVRFRLSRWDLYQIVRLTASQRPLRRVALPGLAGFVFLGHAVDGNYLRGAVWACVVAALYWGISNLMYLLYVYGGGNETLLVPQEISLFDDRMVVQSEYSREEFPKPRPQDVRSAGNSLILVRDDGTRLIFIRSSFEDPEGFEQVRKWAKSHWGSAEN